MVVMSYTLSFFNVPFIHNRVCNVQTSSAISFYPIYWLILFGGVIAPILEEIAFRLPIRYRNLNLFFGIVSLYLVLVFFNQTSAFKIFIQQDWDYLVKRLIRLQSFTLTFGAIALLTLAIRFIKPVNLVITKVWNHHLFLVFLILSISFGLLHAQTSLSTNPLWAIMQAMPFVIPSFYVGYLRLSFGLKQSILLHIAWNVSILLLTYTFG